MRERKDKVSAGAREGEEGLGRGGGCVRERERRRDRWRECH